MSWKFKSYLTLSEKSPGVLSLFRTMKAPSGCSTFMRISSAFVLVTFPTYHLIKFLFRQDEYFTRFEKECGMQFKKQCNLIIIKRYVVKLFKFLLCVILSYMMITHQWGREICISTNNQIKLKILLMWFHFDIIERHHSNCTILFSTIPIFIIISA